MNSLESEPSPGPSSTPAAARPGGASLWRRLALTLGMIRFSHSIFALPFALLAAVMAAGGLPRAGVLFWIVAACACARSAAMAFNRLHDEPLDRLNPRTKDWALPAGLLSRRFAWAFCVACSAGFVACAGMLNPLALELSPLALAILFGYSTAKRWTQWSHLLLGLALGVAPAGAWIGVLGRLDATPVVLSAAVLFWAAGFDMIYSCQDVQFDRQQGLFSLPSRLGVARALASSAACHAASLVLFLIVGWLGGLGACYAIALAVASLALAWEQSIVSPRDLSRVNAAFFTANGWVSVVLFLGGLIDVLRR